MIFCFYIHHYAIDIGSVTIKHNIYTRIEEESIKCRQWHVNISGSFMYTIVNM